MVDVWSENQSLNVPLREYDFKSTSYGLESIPAKEASVDRRDSRRIPSTVEELRDLYVKAVVENEELKEEILGFKNELAHEKRRRTDAELAERQLSTELQNVEAQYSKLYNRYRSESTNGQANEEGTARATAEELETLRLKVKEKDKLINELEGSLSSLRVASSEADFLRLKLKEGEKLNTEVDSLRSRLDEHERLTSELATLRAKLGELERLPAEIDTLRMRSKDLESENETESLFSLEREKCTSLRDKMSFMESERRELERALEFERHNRQEFENRAANAEGYCKQIEQERAIRKMEVEDLISRLRIAEDTLRADQSKRRVLEEQLTWYISNQSSFINSMSAEVFSQPPMPGDGRPSSPHTRGRTVLQRETSAGGGAPAAHEEVLSRILEDELREERRRRAESEGLVWREQQRALAERQALEAELAEERRKLVEQELRRKEDRQRLLEEEKRARDLEAALEKARGERGSFALGRASPESLSPPYAIEYERAKLHPVPDRKKQEKSYLTGKPSHSPSEQRLQEVRYNRNLENEVRRLQKTVKNAVASVETDMQQMDRVAGRSTSRGRETSRRSYGRFF